MNSSVKRFVVAAVIATVVMPAGVATTESVAPLAAVMANVVASGALASLPPIVVKIANKYGYTRDNDVVKNIEAMQSNVIWHISSTFVAPLVYYCATGYNNSLALAATLECSMLGAGLTGASALIMKLVRATAKKQHNQEALELVGENPGAFVGTKGLICAAWLVALFDRRLQPFSG